MGQEETEMEQKSDRNGTEEPQKRDSNGTGTKSHRTSPPGGSTVRKRSQESQMTSTPSTSPSTESKRKRKKAKKGRKTFAKETDFRAPKDVTGQKGRKMAEEKENGKKAGKGARMSVFFWFSYFSFTAFLVLVVAAFFQLQLISIQHELATLKLNLTGCEEEKLRNLKKRSSAEHDQEEDSQVPDIQAAHLRGTNPIQRIEKQGKIGPWIASSTDAAFISLKKKSTEVEIGQSGIYFVYAQVYYLTSEPYNSFQILSYRGAEERRNHRNVATCACQGSSSLGEVSCYTAHTGSFRSGERLYLSQIEQNRIIHLGDGYSYFGVVLLRKNTTMRRGKRRKLLPPKESSAR